MHCNPAILPIIFSPLVVLIFSYNLPTMTAFELPSFLPLTAQMQFLLFVTMSFLRPVVPGYISLLPRRCSSIRITTKFRPSSYRERISTHIGNTTIVSSVIALITFTARDALY
ncbi:hypothetical protein BDR07DRAFT_1421347 [Suillus spraguei]|nr:hypothetical protein BDR07DRAFT_1445442 [Suillus spraguei]KAG2357079.1 hypothetical protein BDR07DRAFT_1421347 [Suillus spraguei]